MLVHLTCRRCGRAFTRDARFAARGADKHCSRACRVTSVIRHCLRCGTPFAVPPNVLANGGGKYCSRACVRSRVERVCKTCGRSFTVHTSDAARGVRIYCSYRCGQLTHGESHATITPEYRSWVSMKNRCLSPQGPGYANDGGRGITICDRWRDSYEAFLADVGRRPSLKHSLHRVDNDRGYEPSNVRWALPAEQAANKRSTRLLTFGGVTQSLSAWAETIGLTPAGLAGRLDNPGWSLERALTTPHRSLSKRR